MSGGLFMPTLFLGAMIGSATGLGAEAIYADANPAGAFASSWYGSFLCGGDQGAFHFYSHHF